MSESSERHQRLRDVFEAALLQNPALRDAYVEAACAEDVELRRHVQRLLAAHGDASTFLEHPPVGPFPDADSLSLAGRRLGPYELVHEIGRGGMGTVYLARRVDGHYAKEVAIKLVAAIGAGADAARRFRQEQQILASLEHPHIAHLVDAGTARDGVSYVVMEYVKGESIDGYCNRRQLSTAERLDLFTIVCDTVQFAHRNLVVHRDLKPSNILVTAEGTIKLLDFGIAKLLDDHAPGPERTLTGAQPMTPEYASPEQVTGQRVTTATDVYALGLLLYELLTGRRAHNLQRASPDEIARVVCDSEPERPQRIRRQLAGDLDTIVMKALRKEPERRYATAAALADDLRRFRDGLPVSARPDSLTYRSSRFIRRHRFGVAAAALVLLSLIGGLVGTAWQARRAEVEARKAGAVKDFLESLFSASNPQQAQGTERTARELLENGARRVEAELKDQPEVQSEVVRLIASAYHELGEYGRARPLLAADLERRRRIDGPRSIAVAELLTQLADASYEERQYDAAAPMYDEALAIQIEKRGEHTPQVATLLWDIAGVKRNRGDLAGAEALQQRALATFVATTGSDSREAMDVRESLALTYADGDRYQEAAAMQAPVVTWRTGHLGPDHPDTLTSQSNYASQLLNLGRTAEALPIAREVVARRRRVLGPRHDRLANSLRVLARATDAAGRTDEALPIIGEALAIHRERFGPNHAQVALDLLQQGSLEARTRRLAEAERDCVAALEITSAAGAAPLYRAIAQMHTGFVLAEAGRLADADRLLSNSVAFFRTQRQQGVFLARALDLLGDVARRQDQLTRAVDLERSALAIHRRTTGEDNPAAAITRAHLGATLWKIGEREEGERLLRAAVGWFEQTFPGGNPDLATARYLLGEALLRAGRADEGFLLISKAFEWRLAWFGPVDPRTVALRRALDRIPG